jgi:thymidylate kinase
MTLELINQLIASLNEKAIRYCHWKSNYTLADSLTGEIDLDLLVDRRSSAEALTILAAMGFKQAVVKSGLTTPSIYHFYGYDHPTGLLVHVHLFTKVLTGESFIKSHWLPFEEMLLAGGDKINEIKTPSKSAELVLFIIRTFIKYGSLLDLIYLMRKPESIQDELNWLQGSGDISDSLAWLEQTLPSFPEQLFIECVDALREEQSLVKRIGLALRVRKQLRSFAKYRTYERLKSYMQLLFDRMKRFLRRRKNKKVLSAGGAVIAFVGPEATGKSTLVFETSKWLGDVFTIRTVHAGKPPSSWITLPFNSLMPLARKLLPGLRSSRMEGNAPQAGAANPERKQKGWPGVAYAFRAVSIAKDRRRLLVRMKRLAVNNEIIICDRYPSETVSAMDSPRLETNQSGGGFTGSLINWLAKIERRLYSEVPPPDIVLRLTVSVETAIQRNRERVKAGKETDAYLKARHLQNQAWSMPQVKHVFDIDTEQSLPQTLLNVKQSIWETL